MNPIGKIKDVAVEKLKLPAAVAGSAVGLAKEATERAAGAVTSLVGHGNEQGRSAQEPPAPPVPTDVEPAPEPEPEPEQPHVDIDPDEPVNVTEELGLDPSPVAKPKPRKKAAPKPVTKIDAEADPGDVDVTPADIAERAGENGPA
ncbi:hypothetical protein [Nocardioides sp. LML1-1-1.1]|uniref:hypothetical protein n=1 Tax=Nocardioides sp. LML1-1-1.1 TaxID=3135248 RepID=UPI003434F406